jgi:hypothetical protein
MRILHLFPWRSDNGGRGGRRCKRYERKERFVCKARDRAGTRLERFGTRRVRPSYVGVGADVNFDGRGPDTCYDGAEREAAAKIYEGMSRRSWRR